jgi:seryl-tRNA synthetase
MLDIQFIRDNPDLVSEKSIQKGYVVDIPQLLELDGQRKTRTTQAAADGTNKLLALKGYDLLKSNLRLAGN